MKHVYSMFQDTCSGKGGYLAEINSEDENDYLKQHILGIYLITCTIQIQTSRVDFNKNEIRAFISWIKKSLQMRFKTFCNFLTDHSLRPFQGGVSFVDPFCYLRSVFVCLTVSSDAN